MRDDQYRIDTHILWAYNWPQPNTSNRNHRSNVGYSVRAIQC